MITPKSPLGVRGRVQSRLHLSSFDSAWDCEERGSTVHQVGAERYSKYTSYLYLRL